MAKRKYKVFSGELLKRKLKEEKITVTEFMDDEHCFHSEDVTIKGHKTDDYGTQEDDYDGGFWKGLLSLLGPKAEPYSKQIQRWKRITDAIPGVFCPFCKAQGFKTDHPNIAVCGACPGWYFYFILEYEDTPKEVERKLVIKDGKLVEVNEPKPTTKRDLR